MGVWYTWSFYIPGEKEDEAKKIIADHGLKDVILVKHFTQFRDESNLPIPPEDRETSVFVEMVTDQISHGEADAAGEALHRLAALVKDTDHDNQLIEVRYEDESKNAWLVKGEILFLEILSVEEAPAGIGVTIEGRTDDGQHYRYTGVLQEE